MKKQPQITEKTKQKFVEVFCELYSQKPIEKISIQEISNKSGYNRSTFYQYFTDIYELLDSVENDLLNEMKKNWQIKSYRWIRFKTRSIVWIKKNISWFLMPFWVIMEVSVFKTLKKRNRFESIRIKRSAKPITNAILH